MNRAGLKAVAEFWLMLSVLAVVVAAIGAIGVLLWWLSPPVMAAVFILLFLGVVSLGIYYSEAD